MATTLYNKATGTRMEVDDESKDFWLKHGYGTEDIKANAQASKPATPPPPPPPRKAAAAKQEKKS